jgi:hypothetical protein
MPDTTGMSLPKFDLADNLRLWDGDGDGSIIVDMGAYEFGSMPVRVDSFKPQASGFKLEAYPVPVSGTLNINFQLPATNSQLPNIQIELLNAFGVIVDQLEINSDKTCHIDMSTLPAGAYLLRLNAGGQIVTRKILKVGK